MEQNRNILANSIFNRLRGLWHLTRRIEGYGRMEGVAAFTQTSPEDLSYKEQGLHSLPDGGTLEFFQNYIYRLEREGLFARFADLRPFHGLQLYPDGSALKTASMHLCGADIYRGEYVFEEDNRFSLRWDVQGPKKNYVIQTDYVRQGLC